MDANALLTHSCPIIRDAAKKAVDQKQNFLFRDFTFSIGNKKGCKITPDYYLDFPKHLNGDNPFFCILHYNVFTNKKCGQKKGWALKILALGSTKTVTIGTFPLNEIRSIAGVLAAKE